MASMRRDLTTYSKKALSDALMGLYQNDPSIRKENFSTKENIALSLISRGYDIAPLAGTQQRKARRPPSAIAAPAALVAVPRVPRPKTEKQKQAALTREFNKARLKELKKEEAALKKEEQMLLRQAAKAYNGPTPKSIMKDVKSQKRIQRKQEQEAKKAQKEAARQQLKAARQQKLQERIFANQALRDTKTRQREEKKAMRENAKALKNLTVGTRFVGPLLPTQQRRIAAPRPPRVAGAVRAARVPAAGYLNVI